MIMSKFARNSFSFSSWASCERLVYSSLKKHGTGNIHQSSRTNLLNDGDSDDDDDGDSDDDADCDDVMMMMIRCVFVSFFDVLQRFRQPEV